MERNLRPLNVGVDIGSRGVGDSAGVGVALGDAVGDGEGDAGGVAGGSCAKAGDRSISDRIRDNAHRDIVMTISSWL